MDEYLFQEYPEGKRKEYLRDNCNDVEDMGYMRQFTQDELDEMKDSLSDISINHNDLEEEKKEMVKDISERIKHLVKRRQSILSSLKNRSEYVKEPCYKFHNEETKEVGYYNATGKLIFRRPMKPEEMQRSILSLRSAANG